LKLVGKRLALSSDLLNSIEVRSVCAILKGVRCGGYGNEPRRNW
jgi:hypothetical protein